MSSLVYNLKIFRLLTLDSENCLIIKTVFDSCNSSQQINKLVQL